MELNLFNQQIAEIKISYSHIVKPSNQVKVTSSQDVYNYVLPLWKDIDYRESFARLLTFVFPLILVPDCFGNGAMPQ